MTKSAETNLLFWTTILTAFVLIVHNGNEPLFILAMALLPILVFMYIRKPSLWPTAIYLIIFGFFGRYTRYFRETYASDTLLAIRDYIGYFLAGKNVYAQVVMAQKGPTPFTYLPFSLFWYLPAKLVTLDLRFFEMIISGLVPIIILTIGRIEKSWRHLPIVAIVALTPFLLDLSADGSNDNSTVFLLLGALALFVAARVYKNTKYAVVSAVVLGLAASFKHYVWFILLFFVPFLLSKNVRLPITGRKYVIITAVTIAIICLPFIIASPVGFWHSLFFIEIGNFHDVWGWNVWVALKVALGLIANRQVMWIARTAGTVLTIGGLYTYFRPTMLSRVLIAGGLTMIVYLLLSDWTTYAYFTFLVPVLGLAVIVL